jgi:hypothetical protein
MVRHDMADVAVLAISPADLVSRSNHSGPHRSCGSLRDGLPLEGRLPLGCELLIHLVDHFLYLAGIDIAPQLRVYASRMHSRSAHATIPMPLVESNREEDVGRLRSAISNEGIIGCSLKVGIFEIYVRKAMARRRQVDQPPSYANETRNPVHQDKVAQMIGTASQSRQPCGQTVWPSRRHWR